MFILFLLSFIAIFFVYSIIFTPSEIIQLITGEYIVISLNIIMIGIYFYFKNKLKYQQIYDFVGTNQLNIKSIIIFFLIFQVVDYYYEDGIIGMISLWFMYWLFGIFAYFLTQNINYYKNYKYYTS
jgi:hypothetical protein